MSHCQLTDENGRDLAAALLSCTSLTALRLDGNHIETEMGPLVVGLTQLRLLNVARRWEDKHLARLVGLLGHHTLLHSVYLGAVGEASIQALVDWLPHVPNLEEIGLRWATDSCDP